MNPISRRDILAVGAAGGLLATTSAAVGQTSPQVPQPNRAPGVGGNVPGPRDVTRDRENPDMLNPPATDQGTLPNLRFSFADAHTRQTDGGWTRQVTQRELGISTTLAGVEMRLNTRLEAATGEEAVLAGGERIPTRTLVSTVPSSPHPLVESLALPKTKNGRLITDRLLRVEGCTNVWAGSRSSAAMRTRSRRSFQQCSC